MSAVGGEGLLAAVEAQMPLREAGLKPFLRTTATEPVVQSHSRVFDLPDRMHHGEYGTVEQMVSYLRQVHGIPDEALTEVERDLAADRYRLRFQWWIVKTWEKP